MSSLLKEVSLEQTFHSLAKQWREETLFTSSLSDKVMHPAYQQIIGLGAEAIPFILRELQHNGGHWFWALGAITRENPVPPDDAGKVKRMAEVWLAWGKQNGFL